MTPTLILIVSLLMVVASAVLVSGAVALMAIALVIQSRRLSAAPPARPTV